MKPLIAVMTCWPNVAATDAIKKTWAKHSPVLVLFYVGRGPEQPKRPDVITLDCSDRYEDLPRKVQLAVHWAWSHGFTAFFKCDDDAYVVPERLTFSGDYVGRMMPAKKGYKKGYAHGGAGYLLGLRAMEVITSMTIPATERSEDGFVANTLSKFGIVGRHDPRFTYTRRIFGDPLPIAPAPDNTLITAGEFQTLAGGKSELFAAHRKFMEESC